MCKWLGGCVSPLLFLRSRVQALEAYFFLLFFTNLALNRTDFYSIDLGFDAPIQFLTEPYLI